MKNVCLTIVLLLTTYIGFSQNPLTTQNSNRKGQFFVYWGWNRAWYTNSDIHFTGANYDFTLQNVVAKDRQSPFNFETYFKPVSMTIPQYNVRIGYFLKDNYSISFGTDHMKYVAQQNQIVKIDGKIANSGTVYDKTYTNEDITIKKGFLEFEHTDGLNYFNVDVRRYHDILNLKKINISFNEGIGLGGLLPRTDATLLAYQRNDEFHLAGYGASILASLNATFYKYFFIQAELKGGYINMPDIRTTMSEVDNAKQHFFFTQTNILFGFNLNTKKRSTN